MSATRKSICMFTWVRCSSRLENRDVIPALKTACEQIFTHFSFRIQEGKFMKTEPSLVDYCKYGPDADTSILGLADPSSKSRPTIIQGIK